jgi:micrococcal nuclease
MRSERQKVFKPLKTVRALSTVIFLILLLHPAFSTATQTYKVTRVINGDTIKLRAADSKSEIMIRLAGIDVPEASKSKRKPGQPFSQAAIQHLAGLVLNKTVTLQEYGHDRYGRSLAVVYVNGANVNLEMVRAGLAEVYRGTPAKGFDYYPYVKAEYEAREARRGMWAQGDKYVSPRDWWWIGK